MFPVVLPTLFISDFQCPKRPPAPAPFTPRGSHDAVDVRERILLRPSKAILEASDAWNEPPGHSETGFTGKSPSEVQGFNLCSLENHNMDKSTRNGHLNGEIIELNEGLITRWLEIRENIAGGFVHISVSNLIWGLSQLTNRLFRLESTSCMFAMI